jgi:hypothetical protein
VIISALQLVRVHFTISHQIKKIIDELLTRGDLHEHLEPGTLLGEVAQVLHPHHVHVQRDIISGIHVSNKKMFSMQINIVINKQFMQHIPSVEVCCCRNVNNDVDLLCQILEHGSLQPEVLVDDVSGQSNNFVLDELLEPVGAVLLPRQAEQLGVNHLRGTTS